MRYYRRTFWLVPALALALMGCAARQTTITNLPPGVTQAQVQSWDSAVANLHNIAIANDDFRIAIIQLHGMVNASGQPIIPSGQVYVDLLTASGKIAQAENAASVYLNGVPQNWNQTIAMQVGAYTAQISIALQTLNSEGIAAVKNASNAAQINGFISNITSAVQIIAALA
jgi:hypothetical protein